MLRKLVQSAPAEFLLRSLFGLFYEKRYLRGYFSGEKSLGWYWTWRGLGSRLFDVNNRASWPVHSNTVVSGTNIEFDPNNMDLFWTPGCRWQCHGSKITVGSNSYVAPNVGIITTNHGIEDPSQHVEGKPVHIGSSCWIGMNAVILSGNTLGDHTVAAAGAVITKSYPDGWVVIGGCPAKEIKRINRCENE